MHRLHKCSFVLLLFAIVLTGFSPQAVADAKDGRLDIYFIDVEGGAATLFVTPSGESLLIDSGYPDNNGRDRNRILNVVRKVAGLKHLDHAAVTHWHRDHYGNHAALASMIKIRNFWDRGIPADLAEDSKFITRVADYRRASENKSKAVKPGDMLPFKSGKTKLSVQIVTASRKVIKNTGKPNPYAKLHKAKPRDKSDNAASVSFLVRFGRFKFLCCGDLTWNIEAKLVTPNNPLGQVDVFMVTHHGLPSSNNPALLLAIDPRVAVMCNGPTKGGHPETIQNLRKVKSLQALYQLHRNVKLKPNEQTPASLIANKETTANCKGVIVKASVAPNGNSYTLQIGVDGKPRTFQTRK
jgi:competence protein ComEC